MTGVFTKVEQALEHSFELALHIIYFSHSFLRAREREEERERENGDKNIVEG